MEDKEQKIEKLPAEVRANMLSDETSVYFNVALFEQVQRVAMIFAKSTMVPKHFRGNIGNCMIALNYANRLRADEFMVFQNLYEVNGIPGITGKLVLAVINQSNKYSDPLEYEWLDPEDNPVSRQEVLKADIPSEYGCQAFTTDKKSGKRVTGPKITWQIIKTKGWYDRKGPDGTMESNNWRAMPEQMFYYRSTSWFGNKHCPELTLGMYTIEELQDITELGKLADGSFATVESAADKLKGKGAAPGKDIYKTQDVTPPEKPTEKEPDEEPAKEEGENLDPVRALFKGLTKLKFKKFLTSHMTAIPGMPDEIQNEIRVEHQKHFQGQPYPLEQAPEKEDEDNSEKPGKPEVPIMINCKRTYEEVPAKREDGKVTADHCENECNPEWRGSCVAFQTYQENIGK